MGGPCPLASTYGSSCARETTASFAARQFQVVYQGGPESFCLLRPIAHSRNPDQEFKFTVKMASPVIRTRSPGRKNEGSYGGEALIQMLECHRQRQEDDHGEDAWR